MVNVKLSKREIEDICKAIGISTEQLDLTAEHTDDATHKHACEATGERLVALHRKLRTAAQNAAK